MITSLDEDQKPPPWVPAIGDTVRIIANTNHHNYVIGATYVVVKVNEPRTLLSARDPRTGKVGNHLPLADVRSPDTIDWFWLKERIPPEDVELLSAFDGLLGLELKPEARTELLGRVQDLAGAIRRTQR
jgi:hypothetical protein